MSYGEAGYGEDEYGGAPSVEPVLVSETVTATEGLVLGFEGGDILVESVTLSEQVVASIHQFVDLAETIRVTDRARSGHFQIENIGGHVLQVIFPNELHFDQISNPSTVQVSPVVGGQGLPFTVYSIEPSYTIYSTGSDGAVVPESASPGVYDTLDSTSDIFEFGGSLNSVDNLGDFIYLETCQSKGLYQVLDVLEEGPVSRVQLDRKLPLFGDGGGLYSTDHLVLEDVTDLSGGLVTPATRLVFRVDHPSVTVSTPLEAVYRLEKAARTSDPTLVVYNEPDGYTPESPDQLVSVGVFSLEDVVLEDYRTFSIPNPGQPLLKGTTSDFSTLVDQLGITFRAGSAIAWAHISGVQALNLSTSKLTDAASYNLRVRGVFEKFPKAPYDSGAQQFLAYDVPHPQVESVSLDEDEGVLTVIYNEPMQQDDSNLSNPSDYVITGPSEVRIQEVRPLGDRSVALTTQGLSSGSYSLAVSVNTPKDVAGNPLDASYNSAIFSASMPLKNRSIFTDKGPISKPPLSLDSGSTGTVASYDTLTLPGASLTNADIGMRLILSGSASNDDTYKVLSVTSPTTAKVQARLTFPDANSGSIAWELSNPRHGMIADDPSDVVVRINGTPVTPEAVIGLRGQVVLASEPLPTDEVKIDYSWVLNPRVEVRRLNSKEFRLNAWNRVSKSNQDSGHQYRYNNVLITPSDFEPEDMLATMEQPLLRNLKYRAYERAYTATLNDPTKLLLNTPIHKIAFPPAQRVLKEVAGFYEATTLPENNPVSPWARKGAGTASASAGVLTVVDNSTGSFPTGKGIFWTQSLDLSFEHVFSAAWRFSIDSVPVFEGVWTGIAAGFSDETRAYAVGYLEDAGVKKIGFLKASAGDRFDDVTSWIGGLDGDGNPTSAPVAFDWSIRHSYRLFADPTGVVRLYVDGDVVETLKITPAEAPFLEELNAPFDEIQGAFFGSLSGPASSVSTWDFVRWLTQPLNSLQTSPSSFVAYEGSVLPEEDTSPWTPIGFHGTSTIISNQLLLDSTSASDAETGLVGGNFHGYMKLEPLLSSKSLFTVDINTQLLTRTSGVDPYGLMVAVDDGTRLTQLAFLAENGSPKLSYGGNSFPEDFSPTVWSALGSQLVTMQGRILNIEDTDTADGKVYFSEDAEPLSSDQRVFSSSWDYMAEARIRVNSYTVDVNGYAGAFVQVYDSMRSLGFLLMELAGVRYVALHSEGLDLGPSARFAFDWFDGDFHTIRIRKSTGGNLVSLFVDGVFLGTTAYSNFTIPAADPSGQLSFGSSTVSSSLSESNVDWMYCNGWRVDDTSKRYVGIWKGTDPESFTGYHIPLKTRGVGASVAGNTLGDTEADFISAGVAAGDHLVVDNGPNKGVYTVATVSSTSLTFPAVWASQPSQVDYRILKETDWTAAEKYRLNRDSSGNLGLIIGSETEPSVLIGYNALDLPPSSVGIVSTISHGLGAVVFGAFNPEEISQSKWDFVRYGITRTLSNQRIVPPHQVLNQWNVAESPERLYTLLPHSLTSFKSSSTGITPSTDPDFLANEDVPAFTQLNQGTPLVPQTQTYEVRGPFPAQTLISTLNQPEDVLNSTGGFVLNDASVKYTLVVPDDVLYNSLQVVAQEAGARDVLKPFDDELGPLYDGIKYQDEVCLEYTGDVLPENDTSAPTPWSLNSDDPTHVLASVLGGILTYGTDGTGTRTVYLNNTPLPDAIGLETEVSFRLRLGSDATGGTGDSQVRFGLSAPGMTVGLGFVTTNTGARYVLVFDLNSGSILGYSTFDYLDGNYHTYRIVRIPSRRVVEIYIDS